MTKEKVVVEVGLETQSVEATRAMHTIGDVLHDMDFGVAMGILSHMLVTGAIDVGIGREQFANAVLVAFDVALKQRRGDDA